MSVKAMSWVFEHSQHKGSALLLMLTIANHAHSDGSNAFPSLTILAKECRMSERQIRRLLDVLERSGELVIERSEGKVHNYTIIIGEINPGQDVQGNPGQDVSTTPDKMSRVPRTNSTPTPDIAMSFPPTPPYKDNRINQSERYTHPPAREASPSKDAFGAPTGKAFHPAIKEVTKLIGAAPDALLYDDIVNTLGDDFDQARLRECFRAWIAKGYNRRNFGWLFDWYLHGNDNGIGPLVDQAKFDQAQAIIDACTLCDSNGWFEKSKGTVARCNHVSELMAPQKCGPRAERTSITPHADWRVI